MNGIFRGHLEECLKHLANRIFEVFPKGNREANKAKTPIAKFCSVSSDTVTRWLYHQDHLPIGDRRFKLVCFLEINGYEVLEFERTPQKCRNFARLIGFGLVTPQQAKEMLGYAEISTMFYVLRGEGGMSAEIEQKMWEIWKARKDQLDRAVERVKQDFRLDLSQLHSQRSSFGMQATQMETLVSPSPGNCSRDGVVDIMQGLLKLLDSGVLQDLTSTDWVALRVSSGTILRLSSHLSTLSARLVEPS